MRDAPQQSMAAPNLLERLPRQLRMRELRVFVAVMEHRSFRKAAAALHVTQPAVTKAIAAMEELLGVKLFDRVANGVEPTVHGTSFAPHARAIFSELRSAAQHLDIVSRGATGTLQVGTVPMPAAGFLPMAIGRLIKTRPNIFVSVVEAREPELADLLRKRSIDLAIVRLAQFPAADDLRIDALFEETLCVLAGRSHPLASRLRVTWKDLEDEPWVLPPADSLFLQNVRRALDKLDLPLPRHSVESASIHIQYGMVLHGALLSFGSRSQVAVSPVRDFLVRLPVDLPPVTGTIASVTLRAREQRPLANQLMEQIRRLASAAD
jgi:DNA-binding transcriptional LysR family regulator